jgi:hypothetical protein
MGMLIDRQRPVRVLKRVAPASLLTIAVLYLLCNVAYFSAGWYLLVYSSRGLDIEFDADTCYSPKIGFIDL